MHPTDMHTCACRLGNDIMPEYVTIFYFPKRSKTKAKLTPHPTGWLLSKSRKQVLARTWRNWNPVHCGWECKMGLLLRSVVVP